MGSISSKVSMETFLPTSPSFVLCPSAPVSFSLSDCSTEESTAGTTQCLSLVLIFNLETQRIQTWFDGYFYPCY